jgi:hypothetical protein
MVRASVNCKNVVTVDVCNNGYEPSDQTTENFSVIVLEWLCRILEKLMIWNRINKLFYTFI